MYIPGKISAGFVCGVDHQKTIFHFCSLIIVHMRLYHIYPSHHSKLMGVRVLQVTQFR